MHLKSFCLDVGYREDGNARLVLKARQKNWRYFRFSLVNSYLIKYSIKEGRRHRSWRNVYLLKIEAKSFRDTGQDIGKDTESNLGPFASF